MWSALCSHSSHSSLRCALRSSALCVALFASHSSLRFAVLSAVSRNSVSLSTVYIVIRASGEDRAQYQQVVVTGLALVGVRTSQISFVEKKKKKMRIAWILGLIFMRMRMVSLGSTKTPSNLNVSPVPFNLCKMQKCSLEASKDTRRVDPHWWLASWHSFRSSNIWLLQVELT